MKQLFYGCILALLLFAGCSDSNTQKLIVYTTHGDDLVEDAVVKFEAANPGIEVQYFDMGSQTVLDRLRSEKANPQADLWWGAPAPLFMQAVDEGLLQPYQPTWADHVDSIYKDANHYWYGTFLTPEVIAFNSEKLSHQTAPQDWDDLIDPKWKGRIVIRNPLASGTMRAIYVAQILRFYRETGSPEPGFEWLRKLDANTKSYTADPTLMYLALSRGETDVTLWNMPDMILQKQDKNFPFAYNIPKSGTVVVTDCIGIVAGAKNAELAKRFYEFVTTTEALVHQAHSYYRIPSRVDIPRSDLPEWMREPMRVLPVDWKLFAEKSDEWMRRWDERIRNQGR